ncbi:tetratricopeptide repeat protein [Capilliphycus salinus ALCB114379]|uniref:tetratricopeptide repeat protein n=1 Tax=Capilliphycus salinus TaxID=2768948 RepID=UPI0039A49C06
MDTKIQLGDRFQNDKKYDRAIVEYQAALEDDPQNVTALSKIADAYAALKNWQQSIYYYQKAIEIDQNQPWLYIGLGDAFKAIEKLSEAIVNYQAVLNKKPRHVSALSKLCGAYAVLKNWQQSIEFYQKAIEIDPSLPWVYIGLGDAFKAIEKVSEAILYYQKTLEIDPNNISVHLKLGNLFKEQGNFSEAAACYEKIIEIDPQDSRPYERLGNLYRSLEHSTKAIDYYELAIARNPNNFYWHMDVGNCFFQLKKLTEAIHHYQRALEINPQNPNSYRRIGDAYQEKYNFSEAINFYQKGLEISPLDFWLTINLGDSLTKIGKFSEAISYYKTAIEIDSKHFTGYSKWALAEANLGHIETAVEIYQNAILAEPNNPDFYCYFAGFQINYLKASKAALINYKTALKIDYQHFPSLMGQGNLLLGLGRFNEAKTFFDRLIENFPDKSQAFLNWARIGQRCQDYALALERWEQVLKRFPDNLQAHVGKGSTLIELGRFEEAKIIFTDISKQFPDSYEGLCGLCQVAERSQQWELALEEWEKVIYAFPQYPIAHLRRAAILIQFGEFQQAETKLKQSVENLPEADLGLANLYLKKGHLEAAIQSGKKAISRGKFQQAYPLLCHLFLRTGNLEEIDSILDDFVRQNTPCESNPAIDNIQKANQLFKRGQFETGWAVYQSTITVYQNSRHQRFQNNFKPQPLVLILSAIQLAKVSLNLSQPEWVEKIIDFVHNNQRAFEAQHILLSILYFYLGLYQENSGQSTQALSSFKRSLTLNPDNQSCLPRIRYLLKQQHEEILKTSPFLTDEQSQNKVLLMVISCQKNEDKLRVLRQKIYQTLGIPYCFVMADPNLSSDWLWKSDILYVKCPDNYESLSLKVLKSLEYVYCCHNFKGVLKLDDDCWIKDKNRFVQTVNWLADSSYDYAGTIDGYSIGRAWHFSKCESAEVDKSPYDLPYLTSWCGGGQGYFLSQNSLKILFEYTTKYPGSVRGEIYEDVLVAKILYQNNIKPQEFNLPQMGLIEKDIDPQTQEEDANSYLQQAKKAIKLGEIETAVKQFQTSIKIDPDQPLSVYKKLYNLLVQLNQPDQAIQTLLTAMDKFPEDAGLYRQMGNIMIEQGNQEAGLKFYRQSLALDEKQPLKVYQALGIRGVEIISLERLGWIYTPIPKCACTSLKNLIYSLEFQRHYSEKESKKSIHEFWNESIKYVRDLKSLKDYFKFAVVRDPVKRFLSCYKNLVIYQGDLRIKPNPEKLEKAGLKSDPTINEFVKELEKYVQISKEVNHHTKPQYLFLGQELAAYDFLCKIEDLEALKRILSEKLGREIELPKLQTEGPKITLQDLTQDSLEKLIEFYALDYELLKDFYSVDDIWNEFKQAN